jgi:hypothetical protein
VDRGMSAGRGGTPAVEAEGLVYSVTTSLGSPTRYAIG